MSTIKKPRKRFSVRTYLLLSFGIFILAALNYVFAKLLDRAYGNFNPFDVEYLLGWIVLFIVGFAIYRWMIDRWGTIARMLGARDEEDSTVSQSPPTAQA